MKRTTITPDQILAVANALRDKKPVPTVTDPMVAVSWYQMVRAVAEALFTVGEDEWYEFCSEADYFG